MDEGLDLERLNRRRLIVPVTAMLLIWAVSAGLWLLTGEAYYVFSLGYLGLLLGGGLGLWLALPRKKRAIARRVTMWLIGGYIWGLAALTAFGVIHFWGGFPGGANVQIEGLFFSLFAGTLSAAVAHFAIAKLVGPFLFGRVWCGWACWFAMLFDLLPFKRSKGRLHGNWGWVRYAHFGLSFGLVLTLWLGFGFSDPQGWSTTVILVWFLGGTLLYYVLGIALAFALRDNRAFCKYVCPVTVPLKLFSRFSLIKLRGVAVNCNDCGACDEVCPMDIHVMEFAQRNERILATECTLCQQCVNVCDENALYMSFGLDMGGRERLWLRGEPKD